MDIYELADMLSDEIDATGKTRWSAKDVKEFFLSQGIDLSLDEIMKVWNTCSNPVCACELLGCDDAIFASDNAVNETMGDYPDDSSTFTAYDRGADMQESIDSILTGFMIKWGETIQDSDELKDIVSACVESWIETSGYFE